MGAGIDLLGCEYLGGCPSIGPKVLNKVELHFTDDGLTVAIAPQGLFTLATAHPVLELSWQQISVLSMTEAHPGPPSATPRRAVRSAVKVLTMRLDLPYRLAIETPEWIMNIGVRVAPDDLVTRLQQLLDGCAGPKPQVTKASPAG
ncbi:MAG: hypothetical protein ACLPVY_10330 [Acidimicrobiia bacterium]